MDAIVSRTLPALSEDTFRRLCAARDRLREALEPAPPVKDVAKEAAMSPYHFIRVFAALFGETPYQLRMRARLEGAKTLLALKNDDVTDVCMDVGFTSLGSFSDLFARRVGAPPSAFRRKVRLTMPSPAELPSGDDSRLPHTDLSILFLRNRGRTALEDHA